MQDRTNVAQVQEPLREQIGAVIPPADEPGHHRVVATVRDALGEQVLKRFLDRFVGVAGVGRRTIESGNLAFDRGGQFVIGKPNKVVEYDWRQITFELFNVIVTSAPALRVR